MRYHKVGTTLDDDFILLDKATLLPITGLVAGSFTININKTTTGNQATTGAVISEVSAASNPGVYHLACNLSTSFVAATGEYTVTVYRTAAPEYRYAETYVVTSDGTGAGTTGVASFTATSSDGRITDGTSALAGATVRIRNASNTILTSFTSDASGLWGPVYLDNGTYTIDVQKSGYAASNSTSIVVTAGVAVGPLTDVSVAAVTGGGLTNSVLIAYARRMILDKVGSKADQEIQDAINESLDMISMERQWPWYLTHGELNLNAYYGTGTITLTNSSTTVTLAGGTWPTWAASGKLKVYGKVYRIASRTSGSVVVLESSFTQTTASAVTYQIYQDEYSLASDCMQVAKFFPGETWGLAQLPVAFEQVLSQYSMSNFGQEYPQLWAPYGDKIIFWPYPQNDRDLPYLYYRKPTAMTSPADEADWDPMHINLLHRAIDYTLSLRYPCVAGDPAKTFGAYQVALARARPNDKSTMHRPAVLGAPQGPSRLRPIPAS